MVTAKDCACFVFKGVFAVGMHGFSKLLEGSKYDQLPPRVARRVSSAFSYLLGSLGLTAGAAVCTSNILQYFDLRNCKLIWVVLGSSSAIIGSWLVCKYTPYKPCFLSKKHAAWAVNCGAVGSILGLLIQDNPILLLTVFGTATLIIVEGYSVHALLSPDTFINWGLGLRIGLGIVTFSGLAAYFTSSDNPLQNMLMSISVAGGLALFPTYVLYHTQKLVAKAEANNVPFDPINSYDNCVQGF